MLKSLFKISVLNSEHGGGEDAEDPEEEGPKLIGFCVVFVTLALYIFIGSFMEMMHFPVGHETGVIILVGIVISIVTT